MIGGYTIIDVSDVALTTSYKDCSVSFDDVIRQITTGKIILVTTNNGVYTASVSKTTATEITLVSLVTVSSSSIDQITFTINNKNQIKKTTTTFTKA